MNQKHLYPVTVKLISDFMCRPISERIFGNQTIHFFQGETITPMSCDGKLSVGYTVDEVEWLNANLHDLQSVTRVEITDIDDKPIVSGDLNLNWPPKKTDDGVYFCLCPNT
jgi:hypothetical protein